MQAHSLTVSVELKDGRTLTAVEPKIDEIFKIIDSVKDKCPSFPMGTE
ncbi:MAG: hypothetical protein UV78_C0016G0018 [Parcubacteria group bacterium GW2011_GWA2_43_17]|nr:MAG: hypothetical protein UV78_C0016G0018 [Parcubacteria group bacterium GW2011_GWA2_43_17]KKT91227.1 MAG: hypothetical protein UW91_C0036G0019 [Parcubacteria group bacterium GW2011_GWF2_45_11]